MKQYKWSDLKRSLVKSLKNEKYERYEIIKPLGGFLRARHNAVVEAPCVLKHMATMKTIFGK